MKASVEIDLPAGYTIGDLTTAAGAIFKASTEFVDWEELAERNPNAIQNPGLICLAVARALERNAE
jgi:hypothetical protein